MKHLKPIQILTPDAITLIERAKMHLEVHNDVIKTPETSLLIVELEELINELKS